jgi:hypothetical protein
MLNIEIPNNEFNDNTSVVCFYCIMMPILLLPSYCYRFIVTVLLLPYYCLFIVVC